MTSLEIKRYDSLRANSSNSSSNNNRNLNENNGDVNNIGDVREIPILIMNEKSVGNDENDTNTRINPSLPSTVVTKTTPAITTTTTTATADSINDNSTVIANNFNSSMNNLNTTNTITVESNNNHNDRSSIKSLNNELNTLQFNKYGFLQPVVNNGTLNQSSLNTLGHQNNKNKKLSAHSIENLHDNSNASSSSLSHRNNNGSHRDDAGSNLDTHSHNNDDSLNNSNLNNSNQNCSNKSAKELIQSTPAEYFCENIPIEVIRSRELKWLEMLSNYDEWMNKRFFKIKERCRKGIPQSIRSRAWLYLTNAVIYKVEMNRKHNVENYYQKCLNDTTVDPKCLDEIKRDLNRQFPSHELFYNNNTIGTNVLYNVLSAYAAHNPEVGYCQSQGPIAAVLVMHMPEEDAFWMLIRISDFYLKDYYKPDLERIQIDGQTLFYLFKSINYDAYKLMKKNSIHPTLYMTEWFMCIFARTLPWCTVLRVWDMFFCEGIKVMFRVGLYLLKCIFSNKAKFNKCLKMNTYDQQYGILSMLKEIDIDCLKEDVLVRESCKFLLHENDMKSKYDKAKIEFMKSKQQSSNGEQQKNNKKSNK